MTIRLLTVADLEIAAAHIERHLDENGKHGTPYFAPYSENHPFDVDGFREKRTRKWALSSQGVEFERMWGLFDTDESGGEVLVGHVDISRGGLPTERHRAWLGVGLEAKARGKGGGTSLMHVALDWARAEPGLAWIDLGCFAENVRAIALYRSLGFVENGRVEDRFRVDDIPITDVTMALNVHAA